MDGFGTTLIHFIATQHNSKLTFINFPIEFAHQQGMKANDK